MEIKFIFSPKIEFERVKYTFSKISWYREQGYELGIPEGIDENSSDKDIQLQIKKEYNSKVFEEYSKDVEKKFDRVNLKFELVLKKIFGDRIPTNFEMILTRYGVGGSYNLPNKIVKNVTNPKEGFLTLVHEIVHLLIQRDIDKYSISHWDKERVVDLILNSKKFDFLNYNYWQKSYHGAERYVDPLFNKFFFKDQSEFFKELKIRND